MVILVIIVIRTIRVLRRDRVHNNSTQRRLDVLQGQESAIEGTLIGTAGFDDHNDAVDLLGDHCGIGDGNQGRGVEEDHIPFFFQPGNQGTHALGAKKLGRIGRDDAGGDDKEILDLRLLDDGIEVIGGAGEVVGHAGIAFDVEDAVLDGTAQVRVDQKCFLAQVGVGDGQVGDGGGFTLTRAGTGYQD